MTAQQIVVEELLIFNQSIKNEMSSKNLDVTGRASQSLRVISTDKKAASVGIDYIEYLNRGRGPGKFPPIDKIKEWVDRRNLEVAPYVIARKIANEGTEIFKDRTKGLMLEEKIALTVKRIKKRLPEELKAEILNKLTR